MPTRLPFIATVCIGLAAQAAPAVSQGLHAQLFPLTGEVRLLNRNETEVPFVFYSISSPSGALNASNAVWRSITQNYDRAGGSTPGNGLIDPNGDWVKISSLATELTEGALDADGGRLPATRAVSLGPIWNPSEVPFPDLDFEIHDDVQEIPVTIELALDGDYSANQVVDSADYVVWRRYLDSIENLLADGDLDGVVDLDDLLVWRENFGITLPLPPYASGGGASNSRGVPEPATAALMVITSALLPVLAARRSRRLSPRR
jgi:hypothetical protein